jgi:hypothetical protein
MAPSEKAKSRTGDAERNLKRSKWNQRHFSGSKLVENIEERQQK